LYSNIFRYAESLTQVDLSDLQNPLSNLIKERTPLITNRESSRTNRALTAWGPNRAPTAPNSCAADVDVGAGEKFWLFSVRQTVLRIRIRIVTVCGLCRRAAELRRCNCMCAVRESVCVWVRVGGERDNMYIRCIYTHVYTYYFYTPRSDNNNNTNNNVGRAYWTYANKTKTDKCQKSTTLL